VEFGGDALKKWLFAKDLISGVPVADILIDHHTARWGVNIPTSVIALLFGTTWSVYYLVPILFFAVLLCVSAYNFYYACNRDRPEAFYVFLIFLFVLYGDPTYVRSTGQLMPFVFVAAYISFHILFVWRSLLNPSQANIFLAAFSLFLAYGAKETSLFYAPGSCLFLFLALGWRRGIVIAGNMALYGLLLIALETLVFSLIFSEFTTRLHLLKNHFTLLKKVMKQTFDKATFETLFIGWLTLPAYTTMLFAGAVASTVYFLVKSARQGRAALESLPGLLFLSYGLIHTFAIKSLDPLIPFVPPKSKYLADLVPWAAMMIAFGAHDIVRVAIDARRQALAVSFIALSLLVCIVSLSIPRQYRSEYPTTDAWMWHADATYAFVRQAVRTGVPIKTRPSAQRMLEKLIGVDLTPAGSGVFVATKHLGPEGSATATGRQCIVVEARLDFVKCTPKPDAKATPTGGS
jgi:hypothetical protein